MGKQGTGEFMKFVFVLLLMLPTVIHAEENEYVELQSRIIKNEINYKLNDDFTAEVITEIEIQPLTDNMAKKIKRRKFSHSTSIEKLEVLEAYTRKADGKKIPVPKENYQITINKGKGDAGAIFSDRTYVSIVFPELEKNDSVYYRVKRMDKEPMFPGHFSISKYYYSQTAYDDVKVRIDLPEGLKFTYEVRRMKEKSYTKGGRRIIELSYQNRKPVKIDRKNFSVWVNSEAGFALSTFQNYEAIASAYAARALPKARPTDRIKKLAREIIKDEKDKKTQARILYDWVATNISYAGNCIGIGAVVPHDTDFILDNRMGDCKDHATLLEALYRTVDIESTQALINAGRVYNLPKIPLVTSVNHVINYIPEWDQFVDSTNSAMPFDRLVFSLLDKPVILLNGNSPSRRTPASKPDDTRQELVSTMKIQKDGSVKGAIHITLKGLPAVKARKGWRSLTNEKEKEWLKKKFSSRNKVGFATMTKDDPRPLLAEFSYSFEFNRPEFIQPKGTGGFYVRPLVNGPKGVFGYLGYAKEETKGYDVACGNGSAVERLVYEFPENLTILAKPDDFQIKENHLQYSASYKLDGNKLSVIREIIDKTPANICSPDLMNRQRGTLIKIYESLRSQVIYKY